MAGETKARRGRNSIVTAACACIGLLAIPVAAGAEKLRVGINLTTIETLPIYLAEREGSGGGVELSGGAIPSLTAGKVDAATNAETQALLRSTADPGIRVILTVAEYRYRVVARRSAGIRTVADLRGKRIATSLQQLGPFLHRQALAWRGACGIGRHRRRGAAAGNATSAGAGRRRCGLHLGAGRATICGGARSGRSDPAKGPTIASGSTSTRQRRSSPTRSSVRRWWTSCVRSAARRETVREHPERGPAAHRRETRPAGRARSGHMGAVPVSCRYPGRSVGEHGRAGTVDGEEPEQDSPAAGRDCGIDRRQPVARSASGARGWIASFESIMLDTPNGHVSDFT